MSPDEGEQGVGAEEIVAQPRVQGAVLRRRTVEQGLDRVFEAGDERQSGLGVELTRHADHARCLVEPGPQPDETLLTSETRDAVVGLDAADVVLHGPTESGRGSTGGDLGEAPVTCGERRTEATLETGQRTREYVEVGARHDTVADPLSHRLELRGGSRALDHPRAVAEIGPRRRRDDLFRKDRGSRFGKLCEPAHSPQLDTVEPPAYLSDIGEDGLDHPTRRHREVDRQQPSNDAKDQTGRITKRSRRRSRGRRHRPVERRRHDHHLPGWARGTTATAAAPERSHQTSRGRGTGSA